MMRIGMFGGTGRTGRCVIDECLERGWTMGALARVRSRLRSAVGVDLVVGDARDPVDAEATIVGCQAVVCCLGMTDITTPSTEFSDALKNIVAEAHRSKIRRIVAIASAGVLPDPRGGIRFDYGVPSLLANVAREHVRNYQTLRESGLDWTLMCPADLKESIPVGHARIAYETLPEGAEETGIPDLARAIVDLVTEPASYGKRVGIISIRPPRAS